MKICPCQSSTFQFCTSLGCQSALSSPSKNSEKKFKNFSFKTIYFICIKNAFHQKTIFFELSLESQLLDAPREKQPNLNFLGVSKAVHNSVEFSCRIETLSFAEPCIIYTCICMREARNARIYAQNVGPRSIDDSRENGVYFRPCVCCFNFLSAKLNSCCSDFSASRLLPSQCCLATPCPRYSFLLSNLVWDAITLRIAQRCRS